MTISPSFDDQIVRKLAEILNETHLTEIEYEMGEIRVRVARQVSSSTANVQIPHFAHPSPAPASSPAQATAEEPAKILDWSQHPGVIKAPMVGTVYSSANPSSPPLVQAGSQVTKGQTLLIIEAMKVMNQIRAPRDGKVIEILFHDGEPVEYDHPLIIIE